MFFMFKEKRIRIIALVSVIVVMGILMFSLSNSDEGNPTEPNVDWNTINLDDYKNKEIECNAAALYAFGKEYLPAHEGAEKNIKFRVEGTIHKNNFYDAWLYEDGMTYLCINLYLADGQTFNDGDKVVVIGSFQEMTRHPILENVYIEEK